MHDLDFLNKIDEEMLCIFHIQPLHFNDFSYLISDNESHYSFAEFCPKFLNENSMPFNLRIGYKPQINNRAKIVIFLEYYGSNLKENSKLINLDSIQDLEKVFNFFVRPICPIEFFEPIYNEALLIFTATKNDIESKSFDFETWFKSLSLWSNSVFNDDDDNYEMFYADISATDYSNGLLVLEASAHSEFNLLEPKEFIIKKFESIYKIHNLPEKNAELPLYLKEKLTEQFYDTAIH